MLPLVFPGVGLSTSGSTPGAKKKKRFSFMFRRRSREYRPRELALPKVLTEYNGELSGARSVLSGLENE